jgi:hypothetical protein
MVSRYAIPLLLLCSLGVCSVNANASSTNSQDLLEQVVIQRFGFDAQNPKLILEIEEGIAILSEPPDSADALARVYRPITSEAKLMLKSGQAWSIVAIGPILDSPDQVRVRNGTLKNGMFYIEVVHTNVRAEGATLRRNIPWRPILRLPIPKSLLPGQYEVEVIWQALESLPSGKPLSISHRAGPISFSIEEHSG